MRAASSLVRNSHTLKVAHVIIFGMPQASSNTVLASCNDPQLPCAGDTPNSDLRQMQLVFETNFWGPVRVFQAALPLFPKTGEACMERLE